MKRLTDILLSGFALLIFSPFGLIIGLILKLTGEGEIFYRQRRVGKNGKIFHLIKFATMLKDSPNLAGEEITMTKDPRVLPFGRILRKTKLNEIPQLLNILKGDMSIVGPRPLTQKHFDYYSDDVKQKIGTVLPGLTGVGSIIFRDEESFFNNTQKSAADIYKEDITPYKGALAVWYVENRTLLIDLKIILLTAIVVLFPKSQKHLTWLKDLPN